MRTVIKESMAPVLPNGGDILTPQGASAMVQWLPVPLAKGAVPAGAGNRRVFPCTALGQESNNCLMLLHVAAVVLWDVSPSRGVPVALLG